ncbi:MAG: dTDP-4-dehydrorhamnose 3,5-epimerase family protein [Acidobacteria bacterium]|nr:dTDP-4-dehydrorhamnose 3,5-epimerase family protein [Acidobacteriota bacterium]
MAEESLRFIPADPALGPVPRLLIPKCEKGIGTVVSQADSTWLIDGVAVKPFPIWPDDRGYFLEVLRLGQGLAAEFPRESSQVSCALSYPGTIKAFHFHRFQSDLWVPVAGMLQVALADFREGSPTFGRRNTLYLGALRPWQVLVPPGVGHGYKVVGTEPATLVYVTNRFYDPADEGRIAYNDEDIAYDWETQHK